MWGVSLEDAKAALEILGILTTLGAGFIMLKMKSTFVTRNDFNTYSEDHQEEHDALEQRMTQGERSFSELRIALAKVASSDQVAELRISVTKVEGDVRALDERIEGHNAVSLRNEKLLRSLHDHLLNGRDK